MRWTGGNSSQRQARKGWVAPDLNGISRKQDVFSQYSNPDYLLGGLSNQGLQNMARRLQFGDTEPQLESWSLPELPDNQLHIVELHGESSIAELQGDSSFFEFD